jgi:hypothetical protein
MAKTAGKVGMAVVGMGTVAAGALTGIATKTAEAGDRVDKMSLKVGLSREGFQEWDYIMSQNGMSIDSMQGGMKTLTNMFDDLGKGTATATDAFGRLGLSYEDMAGMTRDEIFNTTFTALQGVADETERAALANDLFGRSGAEMAPLLAQSAESVEALRSRAHDLGMVLGDETVDSAVLLGDTLDDLKGAGAGLMNSLGSALMPVLQTVADTMLENLPMIQDLFAKLAPILADVFSKLLPPLIDLISTLLPPLLDLFAQIMPVLGEIMDAVMPVIIDLLEMLLPPIIEIVNMLLPLLISLITPLLPLLQPILALLQPFIDLLMMIITPLVQILNQILPPLSRLFGDIAQRVLPPLTRAFQLVADVVGTHVKNVFTGINSVIDGAKSVFTGLMNFIDRTFIQKWKNAWNSVKSIFSNVWTGIKNAFKSPVNWIIDGFNKFTRGINKIKIPDWVPGVGGKGINIPSIPRLEVGMDYVPFDDFPALLHKGERVLTADEAKGYRKDEQVTYNIYLNNMPASDSDKRKLAQYIEEERRRGLKAKGAMA